MLKNKQIYSKLFKNYYISKFQKKNNILKKNFQNTEVFLSAGSLTEPFIKDLITYATLLFSRRPLFTYKKQSKQNILNQNMYFKINVSQYESLNLLIKASNLILPHQENYLLAKFPTARSEQDTTSLVFKTCLTSEEIQFLPKNNATKILNTFNLIINFNSSDSNKNMLLFFFRFYHFPFN